VPHAGFGLRFERTILYATGMANVRAIAFSALGKRSATPSCTISTGRN
jgi:aspartyl/asparaginyl-tRNA synthetase